LDALDQEIVRGITQRARRAKAVRKRPR
jgi:hypothetical protein